MADENPPAPSESGDDITKSETIRITLPPKSEQPAVKRETVRINVPGKPTMPPAGIAPKKETTKLPSGSEEATAPGTPAPPAGVSKPFIPPPPGAKPLPSAPMSAPRPPGGVAPPPKPPTLGARPPAPLKPAVPVAPAASPEPVTQRGAVPKKETARITIPTEGAKPSLPKATVKMQQTQPLAKSPSAIQTVPSLQTAPLPSGPAADPLIGPLSIAAFVLSLVAAGIVYFIYYTASNELPI
jgi:hypothetical protein